MQKENKTYWKNLWIKVKRRLKIYSVIFGTFVIIYILAHLFILW
jgi:hypothetical protein